MFCGELWKYYNNSVYTYVQSQSLAQTPREMDHGRNLVSYTTNDRRSRNGRGVGMLEFNNLAAGFSNDFTLFKSFPLAIGFIRKYTKNDLFFIGKHHLYILQLCETVCISRKTIVATTYYNI